MTGTARRSHPRGFTLVELAVTTAILAIVLVALFSVVQGQQNAFFQGNLQRAAQGSARSALAYVEQRVATAGFGMDASLAFDFATAAAPCPALAEPCDRDRIDGNDELVFFARNPRYWVPEDYLAEPVGNAWRIVSVVGDTVTVNARPGDGFPAGRILQAVCKGGSLYAYFTVGQPASLDAAASPGPLPIALLGTVATDPFRRQDQATDGCFSSGQARLFLVDRFRFHVRPVQVGAGVQPYLVLDTGLDAAGDGRDERDEVVVAEGVESFQVGYVMNNPDLVPRGTVAGTAIAFNPGFPGLNAGSGMTTLDFPGAIVSLSASQYLPTSWYPYKFGPPPAAQRLTDHQANIRAVKLTLVVRGPEPDPARPRVETLTPILNQTTLPDWIDPNVPYNRTRAEATVPVRNLAARLMLDN